MPPVAPSLTNPPLWLASASPRRRQLLTDAGIPHQVISSGIDDGLLNPGSTSAVLWVMALAHLKARAARVKLTFAGHTTGLILGADTVCSVDSAILGQPADASHARNMLRAMAGRTHQTITGICLLPLTGPHRLITHDVATVHVGPLTDSQIETYIASNEWSGKAGAYNLAERVADNWPITCDGDPATVMGLPIKRLPQWLRQAAAFLERSPSC
jgi:septum formation protein